MHHPAEQTSLLIDGILDSLPDRFANDSSDALEKFIKRYYRQTPENDFSSSTPEDFGGAAISHWQLMQRRQPGEALVKVFNPRVEQHGWQCAHTVVEIVADDMPYLVNSLTMAITHAGLNIHLTVHPILHVVRDSKGNYLTLTSAEDNDKNDKKTKSKKDKPAGTSGNTSDNTYAESLVHLQIDRLVDDTQITNLQAEIDKTIFQVASVHSDSAELVAQPANMAKLLESQLDLDDQAKSMLELLDWLDSSHFHVFGAGEFKQRKKTATEIADFKLVKDSALGLMRGNNRFDGLDPTAVLGEHIMTTNGGSEVPPLVAIGKASVRSPLNRPETLDVISCRSPDGKRVAVIVGLFTQSMNNRETEFIPLLRDKTQQVLQASGYERGTHDGKSLSDTMENLPRDLLFQAEPEEILTIARGIVNLQERQRIKLFGSLASGGRYYNCLVYILSLIHI